MSAREYAEWTIYLQSHPTVAEILDWQMAALLSLLHSVHRPAGAAVVPPQDWSMHERLRPRSAAEIAQAESDRLRREFGV